MHRMPENPKHRVFRHFCAVERKGFGILLSLALFFSYTEEEFGKGKTEKCRILFLI